MTLGLTPSLLRLPQLPPAGRAEDTPSLFTALPGYCGETPPALGLLPPRLPPFCCPCWKGGNPSIWFPVGHMLAPSRVP